VDGFSETDVRVSLEVLAKLGAAALLGGAIGFERERAGRPAGIRTHMLLVIGVTLIAEVSKAFGGVDPSRIAAQIVTGVGFLGAGTILRTGLDVKGLTTAASLWAASAIGLAVSVGGAFLLIAAAATLLTLFTLAIVDNIEKRLVPHAHPRDLLLRLSGRSQVGALVGLLSEAGMNVSAVKFEDDSSGPTCRMSVRGDPARILTMASELEGVKEAEWAD